MTPLTARTPSGTETALRRVLGLVAVASLFPLTGLPAQDERPPDAPPVVEVVAKDYEFELPAQVSSGWTTFEFRNVGEEEHFFSLTRLPEGKTYRDFEAGPAALFDEVWNRYSAREITRSEMFETLRAEVSEWYLEGAEPSGGVGLTEPGETSRVTVKLDPGTYVLECAVKTPQGSWHIFRGMGEDLTVTAAPNQASPPEADVELTLSNYEIDIARELTAGTQTVAVHVRENPEGLGGHGVDLARLADETGLEEVVEWMAPYELGRYRAPAPGHWLGGVRPMRAGETAYMTADLEPGRYAWISEDHADQGMVETFTVE